MTNATLAQKFLAARAIYNTTTEIADVEYEVVFDLELNEDEENARCSVISERHGLQTMLDAMNSAEEKMMNGLRSLLAAAGRSEMFEDLQRIPVRCAEIMIRG